MRKLSKFVTLQIFLAVAAFVLAAWIFFEERPSVVEKQQLQQQLTSIQQKNSSLEKAASSSSLSSSQSRTLVREGVALFHKQDYQGALAKYKQALAISPNDPYAWSLDGYTLFKAGEIPESITANEKAAQLDPANPLTFLNLAKAYCSEKQYDKALQALVNRPTADGLVVIRGYVNSDGELRKVCAPILGQVAQELSQPTTH